MSVIGKWECCATRSLTHGQLPLAAAVAGPPTRCGVVGAALDVEVPVGVLALGLVPPAQALQVHLGAVPARPSPLATFGRLRSLLVPHRPWGTARGLGGTGTLVGGRLGYPVKGRSMSVNTVNIG